MTELNLSSKPSMPVRLIQSVIKIFQMIPYSLIAFLGRFSIAAVFWKSGQTKIEGLSIDIIQGTFNIGTPHLASSTIPLFESIYKLPLIPPEIAAYMSAFAENFFPILILFGFATRFSALALLIMTAVIEIFVFPNAYPMHGTWATICLILMTKGPGMFSIDHLIAKHFGLHNRTDH